MIKNLILFSWIISSSVICDGQRFYVSTNDSKLYRITLAGNQMSYDQMSVCYTGAIGSIAIYKDILYFQSGSHMRRGKIVAKSVLDCADLGTFTGIGNSLTVDRNEVLYAAGSTKLNKIDITNSNITFLGDMPFSSGGDLICYRDDLYMAAQDGIVKINKNDPMLSTMVLPMPDQKIYGMVVVPGAGNSLRVFVLVNESPKTSVIEIDLENNAVISKTGTLPFEAFDAASGIESSLDPEIEIDDIKIDQDCISANIQIICDPPPAAYTFKLNSNSNSTGIFDGLKPGRYSLYIKSNSGKEKNTDIIIPEFTPPKLTISEIKKLPTCNTNGSISFNINADKNLYKLALGANTYPFDHVFNELSPGDYQFDLLSATGCLFQKIKVSLGIECSPIAISGVTSTAECENFGRYTLQVYAGLHTAKYTYRLNNELNSTGIFKGLAPGKYQILVESSEGNSKVIDYILADTRPASPILAMNKKDPACQLRGSIAFDLGSQAGKYNIIYNKAIYPATKQFVSLIAGAYHFDFIDNQGCIVDTVSVSLIKLENCDPISFPNTFTPNGDGINDVFRATPNVKVQDYKIMLYTRWGEHILTSNDIEGEWTGIYNGKDAPAGVYYWVIQYATGDKTYYQQKGYITLIR